MSQELTPKDIAEVLLSIRKDFLKTAELLIRNYGMQEAAKAKDN